MKDTLADRNARHLRFRTKPETRLLGGRYRVKRMIGRAGVGDVYLGDDLLLERPVAIKILHQDVARDVSCLDRFRREAMTLASVHSPHVVGVYDIGLADECVYLVMQHIEGRTIEQETARGGKLQLPRAEAILKQLLEGLAAMHAHGLAHRDLQPSNVLLDRHGDVVLLDLGILFDTRRPPSVSVQATVTTELAADVYQVGLLMVFLLTGIDVERSRTTLAELLEELPAPLGDVARRAVHAEPSRRFPSAMTMQDAVAAALDRTICQPWRPRTRPVSTRDLAKHMTTPLITPVIVRRPRVLVVESDTSRSMLKWMLAATYEVTSASTGADALAQVEAGARFNAILCALPDPVPLHEALGLAFPDQEAALVYVTGSATAPEAYAFLATVAHKTLVRPLDGRVLRRVIDEHIALART